MATIPLPVTVTQSINDGWDGTEIQFNKDSEVSQTLTDNNNDEFQLNLLCGANTYVCNGSEGYSNYREELSFTVQDTEYFCEDCGPENDTCTFQIVCPEEVTKTQNNDATLDTKKEINEYAVLDEYNVAAVNNILYYTLDSCRNLWAENNYCYSKESKIDNNGFDASSMPKFKNVQDLINGTSGQELHNIFVKCLKANMLEKHVIHHTVDSKLKKKYAIPVLSAFDWRNETDKTMCVAKDLNKKNVDPCGYSKNEPKNYIHDPECDVVEENWLTVAEYREGPIV